MIGIIADSTCDLPKEIIDKYNINIIPIGVKIDGRTYNDADFEDTSKFYEALMNVKGAPVREIPSEQTYLSMIEKGVFNGVMEYIIFVPTANSALEYLKNAKSAKNACKFSNKMGHVRVHVMDTLGVFHGYGYTVLKAAKMIEDGSSYEQTIETCEIEKSKVKHLLAGADMKFLQKKVNASSTSEMRDFMPIVTLNKNGKGTLVNKGVSTKKIADFFVDEFKENVDLDSCDYVIIGYSTDADLAKEVKEMFIKETNFTGEIYIMYTGLANCSKVGRGMVSMYFTAKKSSFSFANMFGQKQ